MRFGSFVAPALLLLSSVSTFAQEWTEYSNKEDQFTANFPSQPTVTHSTYMSQYGAELPARIYSAEKGKNRYSLSVVEYGQIEKILTEKAEKCASKTEGCYGGTGFSGVGHWRLDFHGAVVHATSNFIWRDEKITQMNWTTNYGVAGLQINLTNRDGSHTRAAIYMHYQKLYIVEATAPEGDPFSGLFQQSLGWIDQNGRNFRYDSLYHHAFPAPPRGDPPPGRTPR